MKAKFTSLGEKIHHSKIYHYDVLILGGGPAGLTAAIYASRYGLKTIVISKEIGGVANYAHEIENYPGYLGSGKELMKNFHEHAQKFGAEFINGDIINMEKDDNGLIVGVSSKKIIHAKSVIVALGSQRKRLNINGENEFLGKGVSYCATCDGYFFKNKDVAVIGAGDSACKATLLLAGIAKKVYMVYRGHMDKCEHISSKKIKEIKNIEIINGASPMEIKGDKTVNELVLWKDDKEIGIKVSGVFIEIGGMPVSDIAKMLKIHMNNEGYIEVDNEMKTNVPGVFAAGEACDPLYRQVITSAGMGAAAAIEATKFLEKESD